MISLQKYPVCIAKCHAFVHIIVQSRLVLVTKVVQMQMHEYCVQKGANPDV